MDKSLISDLDYLQWLNNIKKQIRTSQQKAALAVNHELLGLYWFIGESLATKNTEWGDKFINHLARDLKVEFPEMKGFSLSNLKYVRRWYVYYYQYVVIGQQAVDQLQPDLDLKRMIQSSDFSQQAVDQNLKTILFNIPWGHHTLILTKIKNIEEAVFYMVKAIQNGWSRSVLQHQIENNLGTNINRTCKRWKMKNILCSQQRKKDTSHQNTRNWQTA